MIFSTFFNGNLDSSDPKKFKEEQKTLSEELLTINDRNLETAVIHLICLKRFSVGLIAGRFNTQMSPHTHRAQDQ